MSGRRRGKGEGSRLTRGRRTEAKIRVRRARGRKASSVRWLQRQLNDPYVLEARRLGLRSRAAFKLIEIDEKFGILKGVRRVIDLGAAPGGWAQLLRERLGSGAKIIAVDMLEMEPLAGVEILQRDFLAEGVDEELTARLGGRADLVLSDMAAPTTGHQQTDHLRTMALAAAAHDFARRVLVPGGTMVIKVYRGGADTRLLTRIRHDFARVRHWKPPASRSESVETYLIAQDFRAKTPAETTPA